MPYTGYFRTRGMAFQFTNNIATYGFTVLGVWNYQGLAGWVKQNH